MKNNTILLIDDDIDDHFIFSEVITEISSHFICICSKSCAEAFNYLETAVSLPDFIFLDLNMPATNGLDCLLQLKKHPSLKKIPVIIYTTSDNPVDERACRDAGATLFFTKIADFDQLKIRLERILKI
ncbi:MAG: response regulator [Ferruginibacter sp.]